MELAYKPDYLVIRVENPMDGEPISLGGSYRTSKSDYENHGFGLKNIADLVNRHHGLMKIVPERGVFAVQIALLVK